MIGPDSPFIQAMVQKTSDAGFSAPLITQEIAGYLLEHHIDRQLDQVNKGYRLKARKNSRVGKRTSWRAPGGNYRRTGRILFLSHL